VGSVTRKLGAPSDPNTGCDEKYFAAGCNEVIGLKNCPQLEGADGKGNTDVLFFAASVGTAILLFFIFFRRKMK
jgi:hypothetical protein